MQKKTEKLKHVLGNFKFILSKSKNLPKKICFRQRWVMSDFETQSDMTRQMRHF